MKDFKLSFDNTEIAFRHKSDKDLEKAGFLFRMFRYRWLINYGPGLASFALKIRLPIKKLLKNTIFHQFCGGESIDDCDKVVRSLWENRIGAILDYSVEGVESEERFDHNLEEIKNTILKGAGKPEYPFAVFKPTGVGKFSLYEKVSSGAPLKDKDLQAWLRVEGRIHSLCALAYRNDVRLFIDAEESWIQPAIDQIVDRMAIEFNREKVIVFNTIQLYRKYRLDYMRKTIAHAEANNYYVGFKIVRGAYMEKERIRARRLGIESPIHETKADVDQDFNDSIRLCFDNRDFVSLCVATHNDESSLVMAGLMFEHGIDPGDQRFWFGQLYGMSDNISYNLAHAGYNVVKYLPYGPIESVLPYLGRRAQENTSVAGQRSRELELIVKELHRRKSMHTEEVAEPVLQSSR